MIKTKESKVFWDILNKFGPLNYVSQDDLPLDVWLEFSKGVFPPRNSSPLLELPNTCNPQLDGDITYEEFCRALNHCKSKKAPGYDGIGNEYLKNLPQNWILYIISLFNKILRGKITPRSWSIILMRMIHKKGDAMDPFNYRGIALVNSITKLFTLILFNRINRWAEDHGKLPESQAGFR